MNTFWDKFLNDYGPYFYKYNMSYILEAFYTYINDPDVFVESYDLHLGNNNSSLDH